MRRLVALLAIVVSVVLTAGACTKSTVRSSTATSAGPGTGPGPSTGSPSATTSTISSVAGKLDTAHTIQVVNLATSAGGGGPALDLYSVPNPEATTQPAVRALAYGHASDALHPGKTADTVTDTFGYSVFAAGAKPGNDHPVLTQYVDTDWPAKVVVYLHGMPNGSGASPTIQHLSEVSGSAAEVAAPSTVPGKITLSVDSTAIGDEGDTAYPSDYLTFGTPGNCLKGTDDPNTEKASVWKGNARWTVPVDPGTTGLAFWHTGATLAFHESDLTCQGTPIAGVDVSGLATGSSAWVFLYGPSATDLHTLVVPFLP